MANLLDHYKQSVVTRADYLRLLRQYAAMHFQGEALDLEENYQPETGRPIVELGRSHYCFHSGFIDVIMTGLVGIRPRADDLLEVNPLIPDAGTAGALGWFRTQDVPYHGHSVAVTWNADGSHYGLRGLTVEVDGRRIAYRSGPGRSTVPLGPAARSLPVARPIAQLIQLNRENFHKGSGLIDGRVWFFGELGNGWSSLPVEQNQWHVLDFGKPVRIERTEIAFFEDGGRFAVPERYSFQMFQGGEWRDGLATGDRPITNGITNARWTPVTTNRVRLLLRQPANRAMRLFESEVF